MLNRVNFPFSILAIFYINTYFKSYGPSNCQKSWLHARSCQFPNVPKNSERLIKIIAICILPMKYLKIASLSQACKWSLSGLYVFGKTGNDVWLKWPMWGKGFKRTSWWRLLLQKHLIQPSWQIKSLMKLMNILPKACQYPPFIKVDSPVHFNIPAGRQIH